MKTAVITLAVIGVLATLAVLILGIVHLARRMPRSWTSRCAELRQAMQFGESELAASPPAPDIRYRTSREILQAFTFNRSYQGDHTNHDFAVQKILQQLRAYSPSDLIDRHGTIYGFGTAARQIGNPGAALLWSVALLALSAEGLRREARDQAGEQMATALSARCLMLIWPLAGAPAQDNPAGQFATDRT